MDDNLLLSPYTLPCGVTLPNRLVKSAMTERISNRHLQAVDGHQRLYESWGRSGAGLLITGNVMIDRQHLESAGNVCFDEAAHLPALEAWAAAGKSQGTAIWVQISHAGRQTNVFNALHPKAPSAVQLRRLGLFGKPRAMTAADIQSVIKGFTLAAATPQRCGFTGVQIHAAHGYLLSQFLSPRTNLRTDEWGGSLENRSRLLRSIVQSVRAAVGTAFPVSVKLNSSDFQRGGLTEAESLQVVQMLDEAGIDLLEISGGTYERVAFFLLNEEQPGVRESTRAREAYFLEFAHKVRSVSKLPLMITGGFRTRDFCQETLANGELDFIGMARPFITNLDDIPGFLNGTVPVLDNRIIRSGIALLEDAAEGGYYARQVVRMSKGLPVQNKYNGLASAMYLVGHEMLKGFRKKS